MAGWLERQEQNNVLVAYGYVSYYLACSYALNTLFALLSIGYSRYYYIFTIWDVIGRKPMQQAV